uniref:G_PROTEIN_RECEP_F1_2 domain-containing protein n=1 Tax=Syphacia muris TaxID=451379 RepID=A0A0N5A7N5_9BILA
MAEERKTTRVKKNKEPGWEDIESEGKTRMAPKQRETLNAITLIAYPSTDCCCLFHNSNTVNMVYYPWTSDEDYKTETMLQLIQCRLYIALGTCALIANAIILIVVLTNKALSRKMVLCAFLALANEINGLSYVVSGVGLEVLVRSGNYEGLIGPLDCLTTKPWPLLQIVAGELPVITNLLLNLEISVAAFQPALYRRYWNYKHKIYLGLAGWILSSISAGLAFAFAYKYNDELTIQACGIMDAAGRIFGTFHLAVMAICYLVSCIVIYLVLRSTYKTKTVKEADMRRQKFLLAIDVFALCLVTLPNLLMIGIAWNLIRLSDFYIGIIYGLYAVSSLINLPAFITFRPDFRRQLLKLLLCKRNNVNICVCRTSGPMAEGISFLAVMIFSVVSVDVNSLFAEACAATTTEIPCPVCVNNPADDANPPLNTPTGGVTTSMTSFTDENGCVVNVFSCDCGANTQCAVTLFSNPAQQGNQQTFTRTSPVQFIAQCTTDGSDTWVISGPNGQTYDAASFSCRIA